MLPYIMYPLLALQIRSLREKFYSFISVSLLHILIHNLQSKKALMIYETHCTFYYMLHACWTDVEHKYYFRSMG